MNIFKNRPLSLILCIILGGFSLCFIKSNIVFAVLFSLSLLLLVLFIFHKKLREKHILKVGAIAFLLASLIFSIYFGLCFFPDKYSDGEVTVDATVIAIKENNENLKTLTVRMSSINGENTLKYKAKVFVYNSDIDFKSGNKISFSGKINCLNVGSDNYDISKGISSYVYTDDIEINETGTVTIDGFFTSVRDTIKDYTDGVTDQKSASLLNALLLGEREELSGKTALDFKRTGITHILALSGMHLVILTTAITFLLKRLGINKRISIIVSMVFVVVFMALVGFPSSVVRAGVMLLISSLVYLLSGCKDNITSLFLAFVIILSTMPYLIYDISLWLSVLSTLGILVCQEYVGTKYDPGFKFSKLLLGIKTSLLFSLFAIATTYAIAVVCFESSSLLAPIATLVVGFMTNVYVYCGLVVLAIGALIPVGVPLKYLRWAIEAIVSAFSSLEIACFSVENTLIKILGVTLTVFILLFFIIKIKKKKLVVALIASLYLIINVFGISFSVDAKANESIKYQSYGNEVMLITGSGNAYFLDFGESNSGSAYINASYAYENDICVIDYYYLLNYSESSISSIEEILSKIKINEIKIPKPRNSDEAELLKKLAYCVSEFSVSVELYDAKEELNLGKIEMLTITRNEYGYSPESLSFVLAMGEEMYGYTSVSALETSKLSESLFYTCKGVIVGDFGDKPYEKYELDLSSENLDFAIISSKNVTIAYSDEKAYYKNKAEITP